MDKIIERYRRFSDAKKDVNKVQQDVLENKFSKYLCSHHCKLSSAINCFRSAIYAFNGILKVYYANEG